MRERKRGTVKSGKGGRRVKSRKQAIAIGLSKARRAGVDLPPPKKGKAKASTRKSAEYAYEAGQGKRKPRRQPRVARVVLNEQDFNGFGAVHSSAVCVGQWRSVRTQPGGFNPKPAPKLRPSRWD